jgi:hypothetical protein
MPDNHNVKVIGPVIVAGSNGMPLNAIPSNASAVVIANKVLYTKPAVVYVGADGNVAVIPWDNTESSTTDPVGWVVFKGLVAGSFLPVYVKRIGDIGAGTSATDLVVCF